ncbi:MAG TPA: aromatic-ring-hydroxylating dioxygenase subunit beta [Kofleriaceae bacterium]|nr:aromatic-ring-hydroxylating dioxygenase subunit beta [Kofleriaceae bacterium]
MNRADLEDFLFHEAALLDEWRLDEWLALWCEDGRYIVPALDAAHVDPREALAIVADDLTLLRSRVEQLLSGETWAEVPRSRTTRMIGNARVLEHDGDRVRAASSFVVHRHHRDKLDVFAGTYRHELVVAHGAVRIREKRVLLVHDLLAQGRVSIVL